MDDEWDDGEELGAVWRVGDPVEEARQEAERRAAVRAVRLAAVAAAVLAVAVVVSVIAGAVLGDDAEQVVGGSTTVPVEAEPTTTTVLGVVGPAAGTDVAAYVADRRAALGRVQDTATHLAVVSLAAYAPVADADAIVAAEAPDAEVVAHLVAAPGGAPARVDGDLGAWIEATRPAVQAERDAVAELLPTVTDEEFLAFYNEELARFDATLAALDPGAPLVFAVVVRIDRTGLERLAARPDVRLVDVAPSADATATTGLRPEEVATAGDPEFRP